jgi:hypothetical protein
VTVLAVGLLTATVAASRWHPIIAGFAGVLAGVAAGFVVAVAILAWPVIRLIWWWATEITVALGLVTGWVELADHTTLPYRIAAVVLMVGVPAAISPVRRQIIAVAWCVIIRHRLRTCFSQFITMRSRTGSLPLILWARPTPAGVRVWVWLRPGLALSDLQERLDLIGVACWSASVTAEAASATNAAQIRLNIKRRDALTATVRSPLLGLIARIPRPARDPLPIPSALDLPDVSAADVAPAKSSRKEPKAPASQSPIKAVPVASTGDDLEDWI